MSAPSGEPSDRKGKAVDPEATVDFQSPEQRVQSAKRAVVETKQTIGEAEHKLRKARSEEQVYWEDKDPGSTVRGRHEAIKATWHFWKGDDWTADEKRDLRKAQTALVLGIGGLGPVIGSVFTFDSAVDGRDAAEARLADNATAVNQGLADSARGTLAAAATGIFSSSYTWFAVIVGASLAYYDVCAKHAENVKDLNAPEITKRRERLEKWLAALQKKLENEQQELSDAKEARRRQDKSENM
jgi:hypothetical protein